MQQTAEEETPIIKFLAVKRTVMFTRRLPRHWSWNCSRVAQHEKVMWNNQNNARKEKQTDKSSQEQGRLVLEQRARWAKHFREILNRPITLVMPDSDDTEGPLLNVSPTHHLRQRLLELWNNWRMERRHDLMESLKVNSSTTAEMLHPLFVKIWKAEKVPTEWKYDYLVKLPNKGDLGPRT